MCRFGCISLEYIPYHFFVLNSLYQAAKESGHVFVCQRYRFCLLIRFFSVLLLILHEYGLKSHAVKISDMVATTAWQLNIQHKNTLNKYPGFRFVDSRRILHALSYLNEVRAFLFLFFHFYHQSGTCIYMSIYLFLCVVFVKRICL